MPNTPRTVHAAVAEAAALSGRAVLQNRDVVRSSVEHHPGTGTERTHRTVAQMASIEDRDRFITAHLSDAAAAVADLTAAAQAVTDEDPRTADLCAALAVLAYRAGDGALGQVAVDRALRINPAHRLAHIAVHVMASAIRPDELDDIVRGDNPSKY